MASEYLIQLNYYTPPPVVFTLAAEAGIYIETGGEVDWLRTYSMSSSRGSYTMSGQDATLFTGAYALSAETLKVWFNTANTNAPTHTFSNVEASGLDSYIKPGGVYPSDNGTGNDDDLWTVDLTGFDLVDNSGNLVVR